MSDHWNSLANLLGTPNLKPHGRKGAGEEAQPVVESMPAGESQPVVEAKTAAARPVKETSKGEAPKGKRSPRREKKSDEKEDFAKELVVEQERLVPAEAQELEKPEVVSHEEQHEEQSEKPVSVLRTSWDAVANFFGMGGSSENPEQRSERSPESRRGSESPRGRRGGRSEGRSRGSDQREVGEVSRERVAEAPEAFTDQGGASMDAPVDRRGERRPPRRGALRTEHVEGEASAKDEVAKADSRVRRPERADRGEKSERRERAETGNRAERSERAEQGDLERGDGSDRSERVERSSRGRGTENRRPERDDRRPERDDRRPERDDRRPERDEPSLEREDRRAESAERRPERAERRPDRDDRRPDRDGRRQDRDERKPERSERRSERNDIRPERNDRRVDRDDRRPERETRQVERGFGGGLDDFEDTSKDDLTLVEGFGKGAEFERSEQPEAKGESRKGRGSRRDRDRDQANDGERRRRSDLRNESRSESRDSTDLVAFDDASGEIEEREDTRLRAGRIPSWEETVAVLIEANVANHRKAPSGPNRSRRGRPNS